MTPEFTVEPLSAQNMRNSAEDAAGSKITKSVGTIAAFEHRSVKHMSNQINVWSFLRLLSYLSLDSETPFSRLFANV